MKKLYRSSKDRKVFGVCGGLAAYVNIDSTIIRLIVAICALAGFGILAYLVAALIIPSDVDLIKK